MATTSSSGTRGEELTPRGATFAGQFFPGRGEMASLIRARDWSSTPLGAIEKWPQSLRTAVSICLGSRHPFVLWWGPERWMFYNDGYRPMLGQEKHPQFLGRPGRECWAEIWDIIGPMMEEVLETGEATWSEDMCLLMLRSGYLEETYFTFSYSPICDEQGRPSGIFNACTETTAQVLAERRMATLRQLGVQARTVDEAVNLCAQALGRNRRDVPFALVYLLDDLGQELTLAAHVGLQPGTPASPVSVAMSEPHPASWPLSCVARRECAELVDDLAFRFDCLPGDPWGEPSHQAMLLPMGHPGSTRPAGVLVLGISPRRAFDEEYRAFFDLVAGHVATAVSSARAHAEERARADKLAELDRVKTAFFTNVSHEFRTPLTMIIGPVEDALADPARSLRCEGLDAVHRNALRLLRLVNDLLDFSRVETGRLLSRFEPTDLATFTAGLAGSFRPLVESAGLKLVVDCLPVPEPVYVDRSQWAKIVLNLVSNAFKFTFEGEIAVRMRVRDRLVELSVEDTATGIATAELARIFDRFHRVEGARGRSVEGTGIGLALVHELVKRHGGSIRVESLVGRGSAFVVGIPGGSRHLPEDRILRGGSAEAEVSGAEPFVMEAAHWWPTGGSAQAELAPTGRTASPSLPVEAFCARVLIAEDNSDMREYLFRLLASRWTVEAVADGEAAMESALLRPPDLIVSDVMMPRMDGIALVRKLRATPATRTIPVLLLSARAGEEAAVDGLDTGADDYLVKPFSARELLSRVRTNLEIARLRRTASEVATELAETRAALLFAGVPDPGG